MSSANTVVLQSQGLQPHEEYTAAAALSPGHLLETTSAGKVQKHSSASGRHQRLFAVEDALQGKLRTDAYAADDVVAVHNGQPGDLLDLLLKDGQVIVKGDELCSNGDGTLKKYVAPTLATDDFEVVGVAEEALSPSGADGFIKVRLV